MRRLLASVASALLAVTMVSSASAAPMTAGHSFHVVPQDHSSNSRPEAIEVGWRHGWHRDGWHRHGWHGHPYRYGWGSAIGGFAAGAIVGSALASSHAQASASAYCEQKYRSYDPASGTYLGYDGDRHPCP